MPDSSLPPVSSNANSCDPAKCEDEYIVRLTVTQCEALDKLEVPVSRTGSCSWKGTATADFGYGPETITVGMRCIGQNGWQGRVRRNIEGRFYTIFSGSAPLNITTGQPGPILTKAKSNIQYDINKKVNPCFYKEYTEPPKEPGGQPIKKTEINTLLMTPQAAGVCPSNLFHCTSYSATVTGAAGDECCEAGNTTVTMTKSGTQWTGTQIVGEGDVSGVVTGSIQCVDGEWVIAFTLCIVKTAGCSISPIYTGKKVATQLNCPTGSFVLEKTSGVGCGSTLNVVIE
jgi:hypothetical protein